MGSLLPGVRSFPVKLAVGGGLTLPSLETPLPSTRGRDPKIPTTPRPALGFRGHLAPGSHDASPHARPTSRARGRWKGLWMTSASGRSHPAGAQGKRASPTSRTASTGGETHAAASPAGPRQRFPSGFGTGEMILAGARASRSSREPFAATGAMPVPR